ncbi:MAG: transcriptional regulator, TetR family protein, partial [Ilumatobacteraceae bacterium]|nr:transcriptional regulator, TetR family protein [Ilumatobacteraceae bacterium]
AQRAGCGRRSRMTDRRDELLQRVVAAAAAGGLARRSLRELATEVGTSHRMLIHHFGSRDGLLAAVVQSVEREQNERISDLPDDPAEAVRATWRQTSDPSYWPVERLFFECYARGAQGEAPFDRLVPTLVDQTLTALSERRRDLAAGDDGAALARLGIAVIRGLLLDLVATGDRAATDRALEMFAEMLEHRSVSR